jgi:hypothetical protein
VSETMYYSREETDLSVAWARAFSIVSTEYGRTLCPFMVSITRFHDGRVVEDEDLRHALDTYLHESGHQSVETVANTIFPESLWRRSGRNRHKLYEQYLENLPDYIAMEPRKNRCGLYFAWLIAFDIDPVSGHRLPHMPSDLAPHKGNQLEFIIGKWQDGLRRRGMFQPVYLTQYEIIQGRLNNRSRACSTSALCRMSAAAHWASMPSMPPSNCS